MPDFAVSTKFLSKDEVTRAIKRMDKQAGKFGKNASAAFKKAGRQGSLFGNIVKGILTAGIINRGIGLLTRGLREATTEFISFDDAIKSSTARFGDLKVNTIAGQRAISDLRKIARKVGAETEFTATQAAQGLEFLALAGFNAKQSIAALPATVDFATAGNLELARAVDIGTDAVGAFGLATKDSVQLQKNFIRVNDLMAATVSSSNTDMEQLFDSVVAGAPTFVKTGQRIETFNALVGKMAGQGFKGQRSGTALRNVMLRLAAPTKEAAGILSSLGIAVADQKGDFRDIIDIIGDFETNLKGLGNVQRAAALDTIFGKKAITGFNILLETGSKSLRNYRDDLVASGGASKRMAEIMRGSLGKRLAALKSAAIEVGFKFLEAFEKHGQGAITVLTKALREFDIKPVISVMKEFGSVLKEIFNAFKPLFPLLKDAIKLIGGVFKFIRPILSSVLDIVKSISSVIAIVVDKIKSKLSFLLPFFKGIQDGFLIILRGLDKIGSFAKKQITGAADFFGFSGNEKIPSRTTAPNRSNIIPPNREDLIRSHQELNLSGRIDLAGAPEGTTFELFKAPKVQTEVLGANP